MMNQQALARYRNIGVTTTPQESLILTLWRGAIQAARTAKAAGEEGNYEVMNRECKRLQDIFLHLATTVNPEYPDGEGLEALYWFYYQEAIQANVQKDPAKMDPIIDFLESWLDIWAQAVTAVKEGAK